ncbi:MAG: hypothetical protein VKL58_01965 [Cyanobacteriota bacterium]|nr:hypothetical protein [Cyanobacteriota bacterium]
MLLNDRAKTRMNHQVAPSPCNASGQGFLGARLHEKVHRCAVACDIEIIHPDENTARDDSVHLLDDLQAEATNPCGAARWAIIADHVIYGAHGSLIRAIANIPFQGRTAGEAEGDHDPVAVADMGEGDIALNHHLSPPEASQAIFENHILAFLLFLCCLIIHLQAIFPEDA